MFTIELVGGTFCISVMFIIRMVHHLGMLNERTLAGAAHVASVVCAAYKEVANECIDGNLDHNCSGALNDHIILQGIALTCGHKNSTGGCGWIWDKISELNKVADDTSMPIEIGNNRYYAIAQRNFFNAIDARFE